MKAVVLLLFLLPSLWAGAQVITYDTIKVAPDDERNIHLNRTGKMKTIDTPPRKGGVPVSAGETTTFDKSKLRFGANLGLSVSRNYTNLGLGPQIGYQFNDYFMAGAGIKYYYTKVRTSEYVIKNNLLGANLFGYVYPIRFITFFAQPEINLIRSELTSRSTKETEMKRGFVPSFVIGGGFRLGRSHITLNYDLAQHPNSPHPDELYLGISAFF